VIFNKSLKNVRKILVLFPQKLSLTFSFKQNYKILFVLNSNIATASYNAGSVLTAALLALFV
jgi:hypothetical protein